MRPCVQEGQVLAEHARLKDKLKDEALDAKLNKVAGQRFHNHSGLNFEKLKGDPDHIALNLGDYVRGFSANVRRIFEYFELENEIEKMREANILYLVVSKFCDFLRCRSASGSRAQPAVGTAL